MRVLLDTNVVLDLLMEREPFSQLAQKIFLKIESKEIQGFLCPTSVTTLYYLLRKHLGKKECNEAIQTLLELFEVVSLDKNILQESVKNVGSDFEDSVIYTSASHAHVDIIITRDLSGFKNSPINVMQPHEFLIDAEAVN
ncbi:PIN domain-containing protein [Sulfurospirillum sp. T05]|uniref:PIN domain-containing protein n=1 Tax=Sulfurospirillum tamanense TaxID=2813362 RepID=A0ABS2WSB5_9BACT|nr:PIN domain-containing protein [Sulfurospirillum tamanensis]MBN2964563.1 PIN domain-containing protein [Sulfurospirillum tamanensis]